MGILQWVFLFIVGAPLLLTQAWLAPSRIAVAYLDRTKTSGSSSTTTQLAAEGERRFAQAKTQKTTTYGSDSKLGSKHQERIKTAGRKGTKRFVDPCKVFVGNLPFDVDEATLKEFILNTMGQNKLVLHSAKVISDWKTGKSKGYGFLEFTDPIYATVCMEVCNGKELKGRTISVDQGKKKDQENQLYLKKKRKKPVDEEEAAITSALEEAEFDEDGIPVFKVSDEDLELDAALFGIIGDDDDDDDDYDGIFLENPKRFEEGELDPNLNREQRREAAKRLKRKKLPHKGFG